MFIFSSWSFWPSSLHSWVLLWLLPLPGFVKLGKLGKLGKCWAQWIYYPQNQCTIHLWFCQHFVLHSHSPLLPKQHFQPEREHSFLHENICTFISKFKSSCCSILFININFEWICVFQFWFSFPALINTFVFYSIFSHECWLFYYCRRTCLGRVHWLTLTT